MKKLLVLLSVLSLTVLASCGGEKGEEKVEKDTPTKKEEVKKEASGNSCDSYLAYLECTYKKTGMDEATIKSTIDQTKSAWESFDGNQMKTACDQAITTTKSAPLVEGCSL